MVPTFKRTDLCRALLASLRESAETLGSRAEVLVVDDSPSSEASRIEEACTEYGSRYFFNRLSVSGKRNFGARMASYPIVLFVDSDCVATRDLLREHLERHAGWPEAVAVLGRTEFKGPRTFIWQSVEFTDLLNAFRLADNETEVTWGHRTICPSVDPCSCRWADSMKLLQMK